MRGWPVLLIGGIIGSQGIAGPLATYYFAIISSIIAEPNRYLTALYRARLVDRYASDN